MIFCANKPSVTLLFSIQYKDVVKIKDKKK